MRVNLLNLLQSGTYSANTAAEVLTAFVLGLDKVEVPDLPDVEESEHFQRILRPITDEDDIDELCGYKERAMSCPHEMWVPCEACKGKKKAERLACKVCKGKFGWWDDGSDINAYFTISGSMPSVDYFIDIASRIPPNFRELAPNKDFYSEAKFNPIFQGNHVSNDEGLVLKTILEADKIEDIQKRQDRYRLIWNHFWYKVYAYRECAQLWLSYRATKRIKVELQKRMGQ